MPPPSDLTDPRLLARRAPLYALAFAEAGHALSSQERMLDDLRARAVGLVGAAAVTTSILGGTALGGTARGPMTYVAVAAFVASAVCALGVLWPRHGWVSVTDAERMISTYAEPVHLPLALVHRDLALHRAAGLARNHRQLKRNMQLLRAGICLLALEVAAWLANYALAT
jgi:hypothetical protein